MRLQKSIIKAMIALVVISTGSIILMNERNFSPKKIEAKSSNGLPDGEYVVDIFNDPLDYKSGNFALTNRGQVYSWGWNIGLSGQGIDIPYLTKIKPGLVKCNPGDCGESEYLTNVKKISVTYGVYEDGNYKPRALAITNDGKLYAWGSNLKFALGLPESRDYPLPTSVALDFKVKDIVVFPTNKSKTDSGSGVISYLISESGDLYAVGDGQGIGVPDALTTFTKIQVDINGETIENVKQIAYDSSYKYHYIVMEDGRILYENAAGSSDFFKPVSMKDGTNLTNIEQILYLGDVIDIFVDKEGNLIHGKMYQNIGYQRRKDRILFSSGESIDDFSYISDNAGGAPYLIDNHGKIIYPKYGNGVDYNTLINTGIYTKKSELELNTSPGYDDYINQTSLPTKVKGYYYTILTEDHNVFYQGAKVIFGNISLSANKADGSNYTNAEKYNNSVTLSIDVSNSEYTSALKYRVKNLENNEVSDVISVPSSNEIIIEPTDKTRRYETYEIFQNGYEKETLKTVTVDLYKDNPSLNTLSDGAKYNIDKSFTLPNDWNPYTATLQKGSDPAADYVSGTAIHDEGDYVLTLKDSYGNEKAYNFSIVDVATPESLLFTKSGNLVYGDTSTSANKQIGTLSLKYPVDATKFGTLKTAILGTGGNEDKFTIDTDDNTKLMVKENLSAGDYTLHISGVDTNNMPYDDTITFTIAPAGQDGADDGFKFNDTIASGEMFYGNTLDLSTIVTGGASSITPKFTVLHDYGSGAVITDGKITPTNIGSFELEAKKEDLDGNYTTATITKTITVKPKPITISVKNPITKKAGAALPAVGDNYTITPALVSGDTLSGTPVYEYIGSADNNSTSNVKVKISGLSNDKYDITFTEHDVTVTQDTNGTEGTNYEITGTKGENNWYTSDVTFKLLGPALTAGYDLFSNTNTFSADNFIVNSEGKNSVKFRMKNSTTGALTSQDTKEIKIDKTAPVISKIDYAEKDGNNKTPVTDKTFAYYFVHGVDINVQASDVTSGIVKYKMVATPLNNDGSVDDTKSKISEETATTEGTHKFTISQQGNYEIEIIVYDEAGNSVNSTKVKAKINENTGELTAKALINNDASKPYDGSNWTNQKINITLNCTNDSGVTGYYWSNDGGATFTKMNNNKLEISNISTINNVEYSFKAMTNDGNELTATLPIKIDVTKPTVTGIQYSTKTRNALQSFLNTVTFDHYFKEEQTATFQGEDKESGIDTFEYSVTRVDKNLTPIGTADKGTGKTYDLELDKNYKVELYALDKAGNKSAEPVFSETVSIDSTLGNLELEAYINDDTSKPYDGSKWVHEPIAVHLNVKGNAGIDEYAYSSGGSFTKCDTNVCTIPADSNINDKEYSFRIKDENGNVTTKKMNIKIDITKPLISVDAKSGNKEYVQGSTASQDITLTLSQDNTNNSGSELFYTKDAAVSVKAPTLANGWKSYKKAIVIDTSGEEKYYFASMSGAGVASDVTPFETKLLKIDYNDIAVEATSDGKLYTGEWTKEDVTFSLSGGIEDTTLIKNYQYAVTTGAAPDDTTTWNNVSGTGQHVVDTNTNKTYWFRVLPQDPNGSMTIGYNVKIDKTNPTAKGIVYTEKTKSALKSLLNAVSFDHYFKEGQTATFQGEDNESGVESYSYSVTKLDNDKNPIGTAEEGTGVSYDLDVDKNYKISFYVVDKAGNKSAAYEETVSIDSKLGDLKLEAYINDEVDRPYDGTKWAHEKIAVHLEVKGNVSIDEYSYSTNGGTSYNSCDGNICTIPATSNINDKEYIFRSKDTDGLESTAKLNIKIDKETPMLDVKGKVGNEDYAEGSEASSDITLTVSKENENLSGVTYFYTKDANVSTTIPSLEHGWKEYKKPIVIDTNGTYTYYFAGVSGAGKASTVTPFETKLIKKTYEDIEVKAVSNGKNYVSGEWTNDDVTFTLSGGIEDTSLIQNYQYAITSGAKPDSSTVWNNVSGNGQHIVSGNTNKTYWFRVVPVDGNGKISQGYSVKIDTVKPDDVTFKTKSVAKGIVNSIADLLTTGNWSNRALQVEMESQDFNSGIKEIKYIETKNGTQGSQKTYSAPLIYKDDGMISFKATAYDNAGNASQNESISDTYRIDVTKPTIKGAEDGKVYYYVTRYITYEDLGSGIKDALVSYNNGTFDTLNNGHKLSAEGNYTLKVSDEAGNIHDINFKIVGLPDTDDIDGSDESRDIIDQVIDEYEEVKDELTEEEKKEIEEWIDEAEKKWEAARKKVIEDKNSGAIVEGLDDVTFDPNTELIVKDDDSVKDKDISKVPGIDKNEEIKEGFDVKLKKGETIVQPDGSVTIKIPIRNEYKYSRMKVVMIDEKGEISLVNAEVKNGYIEFTTDKPNNKFALVGEKEKDPNVDKDTDGDGLPDVNVDVNGDGKADINIDTNSDGIPDVNIDTDGDGVPDYNIDIDNDGKADVNIGPVKKPWKPDLCVDYDKDGKKDWCTSTYKKPYLNIDTDGDGRPDINIDLDGDMVADLNIDVDEDNIPDIDIDSNGDGKPDVNVDTDDDGYADENLYEIKVWKPGKDVDGKIKYDTMSDLKEKNKKLDEKNNDKNNGNGSDGKTDGSGGSSKSVKGVNTIKNAGASTGDYSKPAMWWLSALISIVVLVVTRKLKKQCK